MTDQNAERGESAAEAAAEGGQAAREWAQSLADGAPDLQDGLNEAAGAVPGGDGTLESDDLTDITFTASDDIPETNTLDPEDR